MLNQSSPYVYVVSPKANAVFVSAAKAYKGGKIGNRNSTRTCFHFLLSVVYFHIYSFLDHPRAWIFFYLAWARQPFTTAARHDILCPTSRSRVFCTAQNNQEKKHALAGIETLPHSHLCTAGGVSRLVKCSDVPTSNNNHTCAASWHITLRMGGTNTLS